MKNNTKARATVLANGCLSAGSPELAGWEPGTAKFMVLRYFRWKKSDWKDERRDAESNKAFPLTPPSPPGLIIAHIVFFVSGHDTVATLP